jgi:hypothetical protein
LFIRICSKYSSASEHCLGYKHNTCEAQVAAESRRERFTWREYVVVVVVVVVGVGVGVGVVVVVILI